MTYRVGLVGTGPKERTKERGGGFAIGRIHAEAWQSLGNAQLVAACDIRPENLAAFADDYGVEGRYTDYRQMLAEAKLDIVDICTWPPLHAEMVVAAAEAGVKAIYCEKPMTISLGEARRMVESCDKHGVKLVVSHQRRLENRFVKAKEWITSGRIGEVLEVHGRIGGADADLLSWGTHWIDMFQFLLGDPVAETVFAAIDTSQATRRYGHPVDDRALFVVQFRGGARGYLEGGPDLGGIGMRVVGSKGLIQLGDKLSGWLDGGTKLEVVEAGANDFVDSFPLAMTDLIDSVEQNRDPLLAGRIAMRTTEIIMAAYESSWRRAQVRLPLNIDTLPLLQRPEFQ